MATTPSVAKKVPFSTNGTLLLHLDFLLLGIVMTFIGPMLPILSARWGLNDTQSGSLIFAQFFTSMFGMLLSGVMTQRYGYRITLIWGGALMAGGMALLASGPWGLGITAVCILGFGYGLTSPAGNLRTAEINPENSASALNVINAVWGIGAMSSGYLVEIARRAHRPGFFLYGTAAALMVLLIALGFSRFVPDSHAKSLSTAEDDKSLWKKPILLLICALFYVYVGTETSFGGWIATYAGRVDPKAQAIASITSFYWGALLVGRGVAPFFLRFHRATTIARAGLTIALSGSLALVAAHNVRLVVVGAILAGLGLASIFPISVSLLPGWFGASARRASGPIFASGNMGGATVPWFMGLLSTHYASLRLAFMVPLLGAMAMLIFYIAAFAGRQQRAQAAIYC